jgi:hypothetical protein
MSEWPKSFVWYQDRRDVITLASEDATATCSHGFTWNLAKVNSCNAEHGGHWIPCETPVGYSTPKPDHTAAKLAAHETFYRDFRQARATEGRYENERLLANAETALLRELRRIMGDE